MTKPDSSLVVALVDRSGSMRSIQEDMVGGFASFVEKDKDLPGDHRMSLITFDDQYRLVYSNKLLKEVPQLELQPRGSTALYDATVRAIDEVGKELSNLAESERPSKVLFLIITDGLENASKKFKAEDVKSRIEHQRETYKWEFVYLGANQDAILTAQQIGILASASMTYGATKSGVVGVTRGMSAQLSAYRSCKGSENVVFTAEQRNASLGVSPSAEA
jgi:uncharacterized protein YegL